jgi:hypothetical protein
VSADWYLPGNVSVYVYVSVNGTYVAVARVTVSNLQLTIPTENDVSATR